tara:strand:- start:1016 stop:1492 length:477 start_codon:yes stop_codon:yes gene_type:complete
MDNFNLKKYLAESELLKEYKYLRTTEKDVNVFVTIKNNKLIDDYKIQQYVNELGEFIQNHINKGDLAENKLNEVEAWDSTILDKQYTKNGKTRGYGQYILNYFILFDSNKNPILHIDYNKARALSYSMNDLANLYFSFSIDKLPMSIERIKQENLLLK